MSISVQAKYLQAMHRPQLQKARFASTQGSQPTPQLPLSVQYKILSLPYDITGETRIQIPLVQREFINDSPVFYVPLMLDGSATRRYSAKPDVKATFTIDLHPDDRVISHVPSFSIHLSQLEEDDSLRLDAITLLGRPDDEDVKDQPIGKRVIQALTDGMRLDGTASFALEQSLAPYKSHPGTPRAFTIEHAGKKLAGFAVYSNSGAKRQDPEFEVTIHKPRERGAGLLPHSPLYLVLQEQRNGSIKLTKLAKGQHEPDIKDTLEGHQIWRNVQAALEDIRIHP